MDGIIYWLEQEEAQHLFFRAFPVCLLLVFILLKGRRVSFLIPGLLITVVILNPLFYSLGDQGVYGYWRFLWAIPVVPVTASVVPGLSEKCYRAWLKSIVAFTGAILIALGGSFLYLQENKSFKAAADNPTKLPKSVISVADRLLTLKRNPRIIAVPDISVYVRQYTGEIDTLFGRNIYGYMDGYGQEALMIISDLEKPGSDLSLTSRYMLDQRYDYLIIKVQDCKEQMKNSFDLVDQIEDYGIYRPIDTLNTNAESNGSG